MRPKIAAVVTEYRKYSHAQHICDRFLEGYGWNGRHHMPEMDLVAMYVDQTPETDLSRERESRFESLTIHPTVADALTLGGETLAVDGIRLIGEHGDYPRNELGQKLYPRYPLFKQIVAVFRTTGCSCPVFNDKHLSWNWSWAEEMAETSKELGFPFTAGSSLPVTWRTPPLDFPYNAVAEEALCIAYGGIDSYDFHALETIQCMVERRKGGETGVDWMETYRGDAFWEAHGDGLWPRDLFEAALCRSHTLAPARPGFNHTFPTIDEMKDRVQDPVAYRYRHADGLTCTSILMSGLVQDFNFAARIQGNDTPLSTQMYLPMPSARTTLASFFSPLVNHFERMVLSGMPTYPLERTLLATGLLTAAIQSLSEEGCRVETPHLKVGYAVPEASTFWNS